MMNIKKFAQLTGVSVRTLHYYDEIGLLKPDYIDPQSGYRFYSDNALCRMQEILFYRELDFSLKDIKEIIASENYDKHEALKGQKQLLILKKKRLEKIIETIESAEKGENVMDFKAFDNSEFENLRENYRDEVKRRWGDTEAYHESKEKTSNYTSENWNDLNREMNEIFSDFAKVMKSGAKEADEVAQNLVSKFKKFITENQYTCTDEILFSLGEMYVSDERFKKNIDKNGEGTAEFISKAIKAFCKR